jgi:hypothetical protein
LSQSRLTDHLPNGFIHAAVGKVLSEKIITFNTKLIADEALEERNPGFFWSARWDQNRPGDF